MYMPVDPNSVNGMWDKLLQSLTSQNSCRVVTGGHFNEKLRNGLCSQDESNKVLADLKSREYVRVGSSRMNPVPAHFAIDLADNIGRLMEFISLTSDEDRLKNDILLICQFSFLENKGMKELHIPFVIECVEDPELRFETDGSLGATIAYRI